ncbi:cupin domain-containing protein [Dongia soli]|uniref:Cupin domain-containing protein n=1 Tax=Dongia soli TaxID=600628 RepID=A0ABU5ELM0_9PROT|nr:cupin domain-containing protein [Dongia soli]MDY0885861.1 cupin domain-containing protein [Dongia soli]
MIKIIQNAAGKSSDQLEDWGAVGKPIGDVVSKLRGVTATDTKGGEPDVGIWECTPGKWHRQITKAEFAHFLSGRCTFTAESGQHIEIKAGDSLYFPANSMGVWEIQETVRKVYIIID